MTGALSPVAIAAMKRAGTKAVVTVGLALVAALFSAPVRRLVAARSPAEIPASA